jgi:cell division protein FtsN
VVAKELLGRGYTEYASVVMLGEDESSQASKQFNYFVHVSSFRTQDNASIEALAYGRSGFQTKIGIIDLGEKGIWYRVLLGPYGSHTEAQQTVEYIREAELSDYTSIISEEIE